MNGDEIHDLIERMRRAAEKNTATEIGELWNLLDEGADMLELLMCDIEAMREKRRKE